MSILQIDLGNSRLKWRLSDMHHAALTEPDPFEMPKPLEPFDEAVAYINSKLQDLDLPFPRRVCVVSVRGKESNQRLALAIKQIFSVDCEFAKTQSITAGIVNGYREPQQMGVDRWAAILGAQHLLDDSSGYCVVDAGSALTIDLVDTESRHLGGFILPGYKMQVEALLGGTDRVHAGDALSMTSNRSAFPSSTVEAVRAGVLMALSGAIDRALSMDFGSDDHGNTALFVTGGDASVIESSWQAARSNDVVGDVTISDTLVLEGLRYLLP